MNNSVDLFHCWTIPQTGREGGEEPLILTYILFPLQLTFSSHLCLFYAEVTEPQLLKSSILSFDPPLSTTPSAAAKGRFFFFLLTSLLLNPFIFIHTNTGLEPLAAPRIQSQSGPLTDSFLLFIQTLTKFTSTPLIDLNHQHSTRGRYQGAWQWICSTNIVEDDLITLQLTF